MFQSRFRIHYCVVISLVFIISLAIQAQDSPTPNELIPDLIREINLWRLSTGLEPVVYNETLEAMAISQANFLISLPSIPDPLHIHDGRQGESARERSQFPEFQWATYGHPDLFAVTEIAAIGSIRSAMGFWTNSDIHTRSALNPTYREVGVAARQIGSDVLFIVVLGGQPNVLPALADPDLGEVYLTNERNEWTGDWMGEVLNYRFLDADETSITDWAEWQPRTDLPDITDDFFYIQYEDANGNRVTSEVQIHPRWYVDDVPVIPSDVPTETEVEIIDEDTTPVQSGFFATNTPIGVVIAATEMPTMMPSPTMLPPTATPNTQQIIRFVYTDSHFTLWNASSEPADLFFLSFDNGETVYNASRWEAPMADLNISAFPVNHCLQIGGANTSNNVAPIDSCSWIRSFVTLQENRFFWTEGEFEVLNRDVVIGTCSADVGSCEIVLED